MRLRTLLTLSGALALVAPSAHAQAATVRGTVVDSGGTGIVDARITATPLRARAATGAPTEPPPPRVTTSAAGGSFTLGELPPGGLRLDVEHPAFRAVTVRTLVEAGNTVQLRIVLAPRPPSPPVAADGGTSAITARGVVRDTTGAPIAGAEVAVVGGTTATRTDSAGRFVLTTSGAPPTLLRVRKLGYRAAVAGPLERLPSTDALQLRMTVAVPQLTKVSVVERWTPRQAEDYERRRMLHGGVHVGREEIERRFVREPSRFFEGRAGLIVRNGVVNGGYGPLQVILNGFPLPPGVAVDDYVSATDIVAMEAYTSHVNTPAEFVHLVLGRNKMTGVLVIWTR